MSLSNKMVCAALLVGASMNATTTSEDSSLASAGAKFVGNSGIRFEHRSGTIRHDHSYRDATEAEKALAEREAQWNLDHFNETFLQGFGGSLDRNLRYLATAEPFGIPYGLSILACAGVGRLLYVQYLNYEYSKKTLKDIDDLNKKSK